MGDKMRLSNGQQGGVVNRDSLVPLKVTNKQLRELLKEKGLPVSGNKNELLERLKNGSGGAHSGRNKPKPWQHSDAKKELKRALLNPTSTIHNMTIEEIRNSNNKYKQYPKFAEYYKNLKLNVEAEMAQVQADDIAAEEHIRNNPRKPLNRRGYPHWDTHAAKIMLERDVANKVHETMTPQQLRMSANRNEYRDFPPQVFAARMYAEVARQKAVKFWAFKRNKQGMIRQMNKLTL